MKTTKTMADVRKTMLGTLLALSMGTLALSAQAQSADGTEPGRHGAAVNQEQRQAHWADMQAKRQAKLHDALKITPAQEAAWSTFIGATAHTPPAPGERATWAGLTAPARMEKMIAMAKEHVTTMEAHLAALNTFYAVLTPEQQKTFDTVSEKMARRGMRGMMHRRP